MGVVIQSLRSAPSSLRLSVQKDLTVKNCNADNLKSFSHSPHSTLTFPQDSQPSHSRRNPVESTHVCPAISNLNQISDSERQSAKKALIRVETLSHSFTLPSSSETVLNNEWQ